MIFFRLNQTGAVTLFFSSQVLTVNMRSMNAFQTRVLIELFVKIELAVSTASASQVLLVSCVKETSMSVSADPVGMGLRAEMVSTASGEKYMIDMIVSVESQICHGVLDLLDFSKGFGSLIN